MGSNHRVHLPSTSFIRSFQIKTQLFAVHEAQNTQNTQIFISMRLEMLGKIPDHKSHWLEEKATRQCNMGKGSHKFKVIIRLENNAIELESG